MIIKKKTNFKLVSRKQARLINEASQLTKDIEIQAEKRQKAINKVTEKHNPLIQKSNERLVAIKEQLGALKDGEYATKKDQRLFITSKENRDTPTVEDTRTYLKSIRRGKLFDTIIKVQLGLLRKIISQSEIDDISEVTGKTTTWKYE